MRRAGQNPTDIEETRTGSLSEIYVGIYFEWDLLYTGKSRKRFWVVCTAKLYTANNSADEGLFCKM